MDMPVDWTDHGLGLGFDVESPEGVRFRNDAASPLTEIEIEERVFSRYRAVESCTGITAWGPLTVAIPVLPPPYQGWGGVTYFDGDVMIAIRTDQLGNTIQPTMRHEFVHYVLKRGGLADEDNRNHNSPFFAACGS